MRNYGLQNDNCGCLSVCINEVICLVYSHYLLVMGNKKSWQRSKNSMKLNHKKRECYLHTRVLSGCCALLALAFFALPIFVSGDFKVK